MLHPCHHFIILFIQIKVIQYICVWHFDVVDLGQQQSEGLQQSALNGPCKAISQNTNERSSDVDNRGPQSLGGGQLDEPSQRFGSLLFLLWGAGQDALSQNGQDTGHTLRQS